VAPGVKSPNLTVVGARGTFPPPGTILYRQRPDVGSRPRMETGNMETAHTAHARPRGRTTRLLLAGLCLALAGCASVDSGYLKDGYTHAAAGDWDKAVAFFQKALDDNPSDKEIALQLRRAKFEASGMHMVRGQSYMDQNLFSEALVEFKISMAMNPGNIKAAELAKQAERRLDADHYLKQGHNFQRTRKYAQARRAFQKALELDPQSEAARKALAAYRDPAVEPGPRKLEIESKGPVSFKFKSTPIINVFEVLTQLTGINFIFDRDIRDNRVTLFMTDVSLDRFIDVLLKTNDLAAVLVDQHTMIIYPDTPQKAKEYQELQIRTFYLSNLAPKQAVALLSKILKSKDIIANENLNSVVIRGPHEVIELAEKVLEANDGTPAEVLLDVEFLEVTRRQEENLGLTLSESVTVGLGESSSTITNDLEFAANASLDALRRISDKEIILSIPTATLNLLKQDGDTRILAQPKLRVRNGEKGSVLLGERVPLRVNRRVDSNTGDVTSDFQYTDVGVKLETLPVINMHDEITLKVTLEVSALGESLSADPNDPQFPIRTRTAQSVLTLRDGETVIIGGLIQDDERRVRRKIPLLGDFPAIGQLFSNRDDQEARSDILMVITPIVLRSQEVPGAEVTRVWSGSEERWSLTAPFAHAQSGGGPYGDIPREDLLEPDPHAVAPGAEPPAPLQVTPAPPFSDQDTIPLPPETSTAPDPSMEPAAPPPSASADTPAGDLPVHGTAWPPSANYTVHVGSYTALGEAEKRMARLSELGYSPFTIPADVPRKGFFHRIYVGAFATQAEAEAACQAYRERPEFARDIHVVDRLWALGR
jgi:general secretion pathway protein D